MNEESIKPYASEDVLEESGANKGRVKDVGLAMVGAESEKEAREREGFVNRIQEWFIGEAEMNERRDEAGAKAMMSVLTKHAQADGLSLEEARGNAEFVMGEHARLSGERRIEESESRQEGRRDRMGSKVIVLPDRDEILRRLAEVDEDPYMQQRLHPLIASSEGRELVGFGVIMAVELAIHDFAEGMPPVIIPLLESKMKKYVEALVDDEEVRKEAFDILDEVGAKMKEGE